MGKEIKEVMEKNFLETRQIVLDKLWALKIFE